MAETRTYRPSNGTEGDVFMAAFCDKCQRNRCNNCSILGRTFLYRDDEPGYPKEWVEDAEWKDGDSGGPAGIIGNPRCTAFQPRRKETRSRKPKPPGELFGAPSDG